MFALRRESSRNLTTKIPRPLCYGSRRVLQWWTYWLFCEICVITVSNGGKPVRLLNICAKYLIYSSLQIMIQSWSYASCCIHISTSTYLGTMLCKFPPQLDLLCFALLSHWSGLPAIKTRYTSVSILSTERDCYNNPTQRCTTVLTHITSWTFLLPDQFEHALKEYGFDYMKTAFIYRYLFCGVYKCGVHADTGRYGHRLSLVFFSKLFDWKLFENTRLLCSKLTKPLINYVLPTLRQYL